MFALVAVNTRSIGGAALYLEEQAIPVLGFPISNAFNRFSHFFSVYGSPYPRDGKQVGFGNRLLFSSAPFRYFKEARAPSGRPCSATTSTSRPRPSTCSRRAWSSRATR